MASRLGALEVLAYVLVAIAVGLTFFAADTDTAIIIAMWVLGAATLGLISGFAIGGWQQASAAVRLTTFFATGIAAPLLGALASLLKQTETTTETNTYDGAQLISKVIAVTTAPPAPELHPLWVAGSFFAAYSIFAMIGHRRG